MGFEAKIIKVGTWLYDGKVENSVRILQQNWDSYYEEGYSDGPPDLNAEGHAFYVVYGAPLSAEPGSLRATDHYGSRSRTCLSLEEAVKLAETTLVGPVSWGRLPEDEI
jgi:hypothetical protein